MNRITIIGAGSWGTALGVLWSGAHKQIILWGNNSERIADVARRQENTRYLPGVRLPEGLQPTDKLETAIHSDLIAFVTPSIALREVAVRWKEAGIAKGTPLLSCVKGIEHRSGFRMSQILREVFPENPVAVLSGPNLAPEIVRGLPTASVIGCEDEGCATALQQALGSERFRIYTSSDVTSIELGGALKNVFALAAGMSDGLGLGDNTKAALVTRSLAELVRLGAAMGGIPRTFYGLSGVGDLIATCFSRLSRNRGVGERLGRGETLKQIRAEMTMIAEGIPTTASAFECARRLDVETPIIDQVHSVIYQATPIPQALRELLGRDQKAERF